jgi:RHS repeat-associated protein
VPSAFNFVTGAKYFPPGALASATFANSTTFAGITETDTYNSRLQPIKRSANSPSATIFSLNYDFHLSAGDNGSVYQIVNNRDSNRTQNFTYDALNRLSSAYTTSNLWGTNFVVDAWGNLTNMNPMSGKVDSPNLQAAPATTSNQLTGFGYDAAGNLTSNGSATYTYNAEGQLKATGNATYTYDGDGNRVKKMVGSTGTIYWRGLDGEIANETDAANVILHRHVFFAGRRVSRTDNQPSWSAHFYFSDNLGSANVVSNATGAIEDESDYYPYGGERVISNAVPQNYKFTAKERDAESGLDEFGARYYANAMGRFMTPDWSAEPVAVPYAVLGNPQTLNLYSYVENNPATGTDPDGHAGDADSSGSSSSDPHTDPEEVRKQKEKRDQELRDFIAQAQAEFQAAGHSVERVIDRFNGTVGFGQSNCAGGGNCFDAFGMAVGAVVAAVASGGESEDAVAEKQIGTAGAKIENIAGKLTSETLEAASREVNGGMKVAKAGGGYFDHAGSVQEGMNGLNKQVTHLERVLQRSGLSESQAGRINSLIQRARGLAGAALEAITPRDPI